MSADSDPFFAFSLTATGWLLLLVAATIRWNRRWLSGMLDLSMAVMVLLAPMFFYAQLIGEYGGEAPGVLAWFSSIGLFAAVCSTGLVSLWRDDERFLSQRFFPLFWWTAVWFAVSVLGGVLG